METVKKSGTLSEISCPRLLAHLHRTRFDGTLRISRGALLKLLYFQGGEIAMASSNDQADHLAPILIRAGKLKPEQMDLARKSTKPGISLARVLVQMGFLTSGELFAGARQQLRQIVGSVLPLTDAGYEIQGGFFPREITSLNVDTRELLLDLIRDLSDRSFVLLEVGAPDTVYAPAGSPGNGGDSARLPRRWKDLVDRFPGPMAIRDFGHAAGFDDFSASKIVYGLALLGCLSPQQPEEPETQSMAPAAQPEGGVASLPESSQAAAAESGPATEATSPPEPERVTIVPIHSAPEEEEEEEEEEKTGGSMTPIGSLPEPASPQEPAPTPSSHFHHEPRSFDPPRAWGQDAGRDSSVPAPTPTDAQAEAPEMSAAERVRNQEKESPPKPIRAEIQHPRASRLPRAETSRPWTVLSILSGLCLLALASYWFVFLRVPPAGGESTSPESSAGLTATPGDGSAEEPTAEIAATPETDLPASVPATGSSQSSPSVDDAAARAQPPSEAPAPPPPSGAPSETVAPAASPAPEDSAPAEAQLAGGPTTSVAWGEARAKLDSGEHAAAARAWSETLRAQAAGFTLQIAIACREESLRKAARGTRPADPFFVTPFSLQGRPCYRLCYGIYPSIEEATSAIGTVPAVLTEGGGKPVVVGLRRMVPGEDS